MHVFVKWNAISIKRLKKLKITFPDFGVLIFFWQTEKKN